MIRACFLLLLCSSSFLFLGQHLTTLVTLSGSDSRYTHIVLIPLISLGLIALKKKSTFCEVRYSLWVGLPLAALAGLLWYLRTGGAIGLGQDVNLALTQSALVLTGIAGFTLLYGTRCARAASFPLGLLALTIPIPPAIVEAGEIVLQNGSAEMTDVIFKLTSTPVFREGLLFFLPGLTIEVAKECSGIRSGIALMITALVLGYLFLRSGWTKICCALLSIPVAILKNAIRISTLSLLGVYVSPDYLHGYLHHSGGPLFSVLSLAMLLAGVWVLRRAEDRSVGEQRGEGSAVVLDEAGPTKIRPTA